MHDLDLTDEQGTLVETARRFAREPILPAAAACDRESRFPRDIFEEAWNLGFVNPTLPTEYGGAGLSEIDNVLLTEELAYACTGIQTSITANTLALTPILLAVN